MNLTIKIQFIEGCSGTVVTDISSGYVVNGATIECNGETVDSAKVFINGVEVAEVTGVTSQDDLVFPFSAYEGDGTHEIQYTLYDSGGAVILSYYSGSEDGARHHFSCSVECCVNNLFLWVSENYPQREMCSCPYGKEALELRALVTAMKAAAKAGLFTKAEQIRTILNTRLGDLDDSIVIECSTC